MRPRQVLQKSMKIARLRIATKYVGAISQKNPAPLLNSCYFADILYRGTVEMRQHFMDDAGAAYPSHTKQLGALMRYTVGKLSAHC